MTKTAAVRSMLRRLTLVKAAEGIFDGTGGPPRYAVRGGLGERLGNAQIRFNLNRASGGRTAAPPSPSPPPRTAPPPPADDGYKPPFWAGAATRAANGAMRGLEWAVDWPNHVQRWWRGKPTQAK